MKKIIGIGAGGNKVAIQSMLDLNLEKKDITLINSTLQDIPDMYRDIAIRVGDGLGGAGKEPTRAKKMVLEALKSKKIDLKALYSTNDYDGVILICTTEGGTGNGMTPIIAKYYKEVLGINVTIIAIKGFESDARGQKNHIDFFKTLSDKYTVQIVCNEKFLDNNKNILKAEEACNLNIVNRIGILLGSNIISGKNNIDEFDLYKTVNTTGYQNIEKTVLKNINNKNDFDTAIADMIDNSKSIPSDSLDIPRMAIIYNITSEKVKDCIDYSNTVIKQKLGEPFEIFSHTQSIGDTDYVCVIFSGMKFPLKSIKNTYENYLIRMEKISKDRDTFFNELDGLDTEENNFDIKVSNLELDKIGGDDEEFFSSFN